VNSGDHFQPAPQLSSTTPCGMMTQLFCFLFRGELGRLVKPGRSFCWMDKIRAYRSATQTAETANEFQWTIEQ